MPLSSEKIAELLAQKNKPKTRLSSRAAPTTELSRNWKAHFHQRKHNYKQNKIGALSYDFDTEKECSLLGCGQPTYYEVDGEPKCSFHALVQIAHRLKDDNGDSNDGSGDDWF